jgi:hypothetical protein
MRLKRLSLPTACSMRADKVFSGKNAGSIAFDLYGMTDRCRVCGRHRDWLWHRIPYP